MAKKHLYRNGTSFGTLETLQISSIVVKKVMPLNLEKLYHLAAFIILLRSRHNLSINIPASSCLCEICENASLMGKALNRLKDIKGHPTMVHDIVEKYCCSSAEDESLQGTCEECRFDNISNQFKDEGNSSEENSLASSDKENQKSDVDEDFVTYQLWVQEEGKIEKKTISNLKNEFEVIWKEKTMSLKKHIHRKRKQVRF